MELIDTHAHLAHGRLYRQVDDVLARAHGAGVTQVICAVGGVQEARTAVGLTRRHANVYVTAGVHPHDAASLTERDLDLLADLAAHERNVAIGEIGLDYHYDHSPRDAQREAFAAQLALAARLDKPIVIHTREAFEDTLAIVTRSDADPARMVFHSFTGPADQARRILDLGATLSFSGIATFARADDVRASAVMAPDDRILVETDAPFLSPEPVRKMKTNEPANVVHVAERLARVRNTDPQRFAAVTTANARRLFGLAQE